MKPEAAVNIAVIHSGVRAAQLLLSRHLFSVNITRGVTFLEEKSSGGVTFQGKLVGWAYRHFVKSNKEYIV